MKIKFLSAVALTATLLTSCGDPATTEVGTAVNDSTSAVYSVDVVTSKVNWKGEVAGVYGHNGYVNFTSGSLQVSDSGLVGGEFVVDLNWNQYSRREYLLTSKITVDLELMLIVVK